MGHPRWMGRRNALRVVFISVFLAAVFLTGCAAPSLRSAERYAEQRWRFIVTGDSRGDNNSNSVNTVILGELAAEVVKKQVDFVLFSGDLVYGHVDQAAMDSQFKT